MTSRTVWRPRLTAASLSAYTHPTSRPSTTTITNYDPSTTPETPGSESSGSGGSTAPSQKTTPTALHRPTVQVIRVELIQYERSSMSSGVVDGETCESLIIIQFCLYLHNDSQVYPSTTLILRVHCTSQSQGSSYTSHTINYIEYAMF